MRRAAIRVATLRPLLRPRAASFGVRALSTASPEPPSTSSFAESVDAAALDTAAASGEVALAAPDAAATTMGAAAAAAAALPPVPLNYWPPDLALRAVELVHDTTGAPWWAAIVGCTIAVRTALLPIAVRGTQQQAVMQGLRAEMQPLQVRIQTSGGTDTAAVNELNALYERHGVSPLRVATLPLAQLPIFMSFFLGLRRLSDAFPAAHEGGLAWFVDLGATDASCYLPAASGLTALALVRLSIPGGAQQCGAGRRAHKSAMIQRRAARASGPLCGG